MKRTRWILAPSLVASALVLVSPAWAQGGEVVQATPSAAAVASLNRNLVQLARNPQDVNALLGAGQAALDLGDVQAANGFFTRANMVNPQLGKAKLGLAVVQIALKQPEDAAANFDAAAALGEQAGSHVADRALAYDLTGQQEKAQRDYQAALQADPGNMQARLRYAVSLGVSGRVADADRQLEQALAAGDREAWRMRAFVLAMNGRIADARKVTQTMMPKGLADALDPYMVRLPLLSAGQKVAAAQYGEFPANVLRLAAPEPQREREVQVAASTNERGSSRRDRNSRSSSSRRNTREMASEPATSAPAPQSPATVSTPPPPTGNTQLAANSAPPRTVPPTVSTPPSPSAARPATAATIQPVPASPSTRAPAVGTTSQGPVDPRAAPPQTRAAATTAPAPVASAPTPPPPPPPPPEPQRTLADTLSTLTVPEQERQKSQNVANFDVVARIQEQRRKADAAAAAKAKAEAEAKAKADAAKKAEAERKAKLAANPSRNWVQIATGRDVDALAFDLRRLRRTYGDAIGDQSGWTAEWGATRRLLVGPFKKPEDARAVVSKITKSGGDAFLWQSEAGEEVTKIGGR